jgi:hypothetical protein
MDHGEEEEEKEDLVIPETGPAVSRGQSALPHRSNAAAMARKK